MLKPGSILNRQLISISNSFHCNNISLISSIFFRRQFYNYSDKSSFEEASPIMSSKNKKSKLSDSESSSSSSDSDSSPPPRKDVKTKTKSKPEADPVEPSKANTKSLRVAAEKEPTWELGSKKFVTLGDFKGKTYVNIREYYTDNNGDVKPGKKGIGLTVEQWQNLCSTMDEVNQVLKK